MIGAPPVLAGAVNARRLMERWNAVRVDGTPAAWTAWPAVADAWKTVMKALHAIVDPPRRPTNLHVGM